MKTITLSNLRNTIRRRCDRENSNFVTDSELNDYINASYSELYDLLVGVYQDFYTTSTTAVVSSGNSSFSVPNDFYKLRAIDRQLSGDEYISLEKFNFSERNNKYSNTTNFNSNYNIKYRLVGNSIELLPNAEAPGTYRIWYIPVYTTLSSDGDVLDGVNGWEEYIINDVCIKMLDKEESDSSPFQRGKSQQLARIQEMAAMRDISAPDTITDIYDHVNDDWYFYRRW